MDCDGWRDRFLADRELVHAWADGVYVKSGREREKAARLVVIGAMADGNAAAWSAANAIWPEAQEQRCWNHKIVNVLDQLPRKLQAMAREQPCAIPYAETRAEAERRPDASGRCTGEPIQGQWRP